jgi:hypothetical protein
MLISSVHCCKYQGSRCALHGVGEFPVLRDSSKKIGTHIFYFNTNSDWNIAWGGSTLVLGGKTVDKMNPDFSDFISITTVQFLDNRSLLFKNTRDAWHGVQPLKPPDGQHRCLFNVIFEYPSLQYNPRLYANPLVLLCPQGLRDKIPLPVPGAKARCASAASSTMPK